VHGDQEPLADDLVQLEQVNVPCRPLQRGVHGDVVLVAVAVHGRHVVAAAALVDDQRVAAQRAEEALDLVVPGGHVDPHEAVAAPEQCLQAKPSVP